MLQVQIIDNQLSAIEANLQLQDNIALAYNNGLLAVRVGHVCEVAARP